MKPEETYPGVERRKIKWCGHCSDHHRTMDDYKQFGADMAKQLKDTVSMDMFKYMFRGIGVVLLFILGAIVFLHIRFGTVQASFIENSIEQKTKVEMLAGNQKNVINLQSKFTEFVMRHNFRYPNERNDGG